MKKFLLIAATCCCALVVCGQAARTNSSLVYSSLNTYSLQFNDAFSFRNNAAALAGTKSFSAGVYSERRFLIQELASYSFAAALPTSSGSFGLRGDVFGHSLLRETSIGFGYGRKLGEKLNVGLTFDYTSLHANGYGATSMLTFDAGCIIKFTENFQAGLHTYNPVGLTLGKTDEKLPPVYSAGMGYDVSPQLFLGAEVVKSEDEPMTVNAGIQYLFADKLLARGGIRSATAAFYLGFGVQLKSLRVDATASVHPYLGVTPGLLLLYSPGK